MVFCEVLSYYSGRGDEGNEVLVEGEEEKE